MKRCWRYNTFKSRYLVSFSFVFMTPTNDDYHDSEYTFRLEMFGFIFIIYTWKE